MPGSVVEPRVGKRASCYADSESDVVNYETKLSLYRRSFCYLAAIRWTQNFGRSSGRCRQDPRTRISIVVEVNLLTGNWT